jgi:hypothetical protein
VGALSGCEKLLAHASMPISRPWLLDMKIQARSARLLPAIGQNASRPASLNWQRSLKFRRSCCQAYDANQIVR